MSRIKITDTIQDVAMKMSDGNPGALQVTLDLVRDDITYLFLCDTIGLYGEKLYMLWNDCCDRDLERMKKVLFAARTGKISEATILKHLDGGYGKPFEDSELNGTAV